MREDEKNVTTVGVVDLTTSGRRRWKGGIVNMKEEEGQCIRKKLKNDSNNEGIGRKGSTSEELQVEDDDDDDV